MLNGRAQYRFGRIVQIEEYTYQEIAGMIDHALLHPTLTDEELAFGCSLAHLYEVATVCVKPYHVDQAVKRLKASSVEGLHGNWISSWSKPKRSKKTWKLKEPASREPERWIWSLI